MAYASRSRGGGGRSRGGGGRARGGPARGRGRGGYRRGGYGGGGGNNATMVVIGVLFVGVVVAIIIVATDKKKKPEPPPQQPSTELTGDLRPVKPVEKEEPKDERMPPPEISEDLRESAKKIATDMVELGKQGDALYEEAMQAKQDGDDNLWQRKLKEAKAIFEDIREQWNEVIIGNMPSNQDWDEEQVANHYLGKEGSKVAEALERLAYIKKQVRLD